MIENTQFDPSSRLTDVLRGKPKRSKGSEERLLPRGRSRRGRTKARDFLDPVDGGPEEGCAGIDIGDGGLCFLERKASEMRVRCPRRGEIDQLIPG